MVDLKSMSDKELAIAYQETVDERHQIGEQMLPLVHKCTRPDLAINDPRNTCWTETKDGQPESVYRELDARTEREQNVLLIEKQRRSFHFWRGGPKFTGSRLVGASPEDPPRVQLWYQIKRQHGLDHLEGRTAPRIWVAENESDAREIAAMLDREGYFNTYERNGTTLVVDPTVPAIGKYGWQTPLSSEWETQQFIMMERGRPRTISAAGPDVEYMRQKMAEEGYGRRRSVRVRSHRRRA